MSVMDGYQATAAIRADERERDTHVPIIAVTANAMSGDAERCFAAGMDGYLAKPVSVNRVREEIRRVCSATTGLVRSAVPGE